MALCNQSGCDSPGFARFTWPGRDEEEICMAHLPKLEATAKALGLHLQIRPVAQLQEMLDAIANEDEG